MSQSIESETVNVSEYFRKREETAADRVRRQLQQALYRSWQILKYALFVAPIFITSILLLDLPLRLYDGLTGGQDNISPSNWLSWGEGLLVLSMPVLICITRSHGAVYAGRVMGVAWMLAAIAIVAMLFYLAPQLQPGDMPGVRYMVGFFVSWYVGQLIAVHVYDVTRGGRWWRAPFYGMVFGLGVQALIYFPVVYSTGGGVQNVPWLSWLIVDFCIKAVLALAFLPFYRSLRRSLRPHLGLGGY